MNKLIIRTASVAAAALTIGGLALATAPNASAASRGTASTSEAHKIVREAQNQRCLTLREARKIVHGNGTYSGVDDLGARYYHWAGTGSVRTLDISVLDGCTDLVVVDWRRNANTYWGNYGAWQAYAA
jgi:hypothetical protein